MLTLLKDFRRWWRGSTHTADLRALAGKWPDTAQWMSRTPVDPSTRVWAARPEWRAADRSAEP